MEINEELTEGASWVGVGVVALWTMVLAYLSYATRRLRQEDSELWASLGYIA